MGLLSHLFDNDWRQRDHIDELRERADHQGGEHYALRRRIADLEGRVGELDLLCRALVTHLRRGQAWDERAFRGVLDEVDAADGRRDGRFQPPVTRPPT